MAIIAVLPAGKRVQFCWLFLQVPANRPSRFVAECTNPADDNGQILWIVIRRFAANRRLLLKKH